MSRILTSETVDKIGQTVGLAGWVLNRRDHGKLIFIDLRDRGGIVQMVVTPKSNAYETASRVRDEWVIRVKGEVKERPKDMVNPEIDTGKIEIAVTELEIINEAKTPPFPLSGDTRAVAEEHRLKYRYLDLRTPRMQKNIRERDRVISFFRNYMHRNGFVEIETPILMKGTPEGSREYVVPSRLEPGKFYSLPQSPQQFKQLAMVAGFERYFQIARCFRDEDTRGDRQSEFTQLDFEMSFVTQEDVLAYTEAMFIELVKKLYPKKTITSIPFPRLTYKESVKKYGSDKPDLRKDKNNPDELAFAWIVDFPLFENDAEGNMASVHHPFCSIKKEDEEKFMRGEDLLSIRANSYDLVVNGFELSSGSVRIHDATIQKQVFKLLGVSEEGQRERFGHMLEAFSFGAPPHAGFAPGIDRIVMLLMNEPNIREVIAFPKTGEGRDLLMGSPSPLAEKQLEELHIQLRKKRK